MTNDNAPAKLFTGPIAAAIVSAILGAFGGMTADRVAIGSSEARIEAVNSRVHELSEQQNRAVTRDEFGELETQIGDMKADIREIRNSLRRGR